MNFFEMKKWFQNFFYSMDLEILFYGEYYRIKYLPRSYLPVWIFISTPIIISTLFLLGTFQHAFGFICIVIGARSTPAVVVGLLILTETLLGPFWVWLFLNEIPPMSVFIGGSIIIVAVIFKTLEQKYFNTSKSN